VSSQGDQCADADPRQIGTDRLGWDYKVRCRLPHRTPSSVGQLDRDVTGTAPGTLAKNHKSLTKKGMPRVGDRDVRHYPINNWGIPTIADAILDRLVHNAHRLTLKGDSMRKIAAKRSGLDASPAL